MLDQNSSVYEHGVALSALITFIYLFIFAASILSLYEEDGLLYAKGGFLFVPN